VGATSSFAQGFNCAQSVLLSFCEELGLERETALRIACGFGAGMGRMEEVCGAVTGGIMVIGLKFGNIDKNDKTATEITYKKTRELLNNFKEIQGSYICSKLLNECDLKTELGQNRFKNEDLKNKVCSSCVKNVVQIVETIIKKA